MHKLKLIHLDLKPKNIFIGDSGNLKIGDFGVSRFETDEKFKPLGTQAYQGPEAYDPDCVNTCALDIWGVGCILYEILTGKMTFDGEDMEKCIKHSHPERMNFNLGENYQPRDYKKPESFEAFLHLCSSYKENEINIDDLKSALAPSFKDITSQNKELTFEYLINLTEDRVAWK